MNQNENASWNVLSPNNRGQLPIDSQAAGISQHHRQQTHKSPEGLLVSLYSTSSLRKVVSTEAGRTFKFKVCAPFRENMRREPLVIIQRKILSVETSLGSSGLIHVSILGT